MRNFKNYFFFFLQSHWAETQSNQARRILSKMHFYAVHPGRPSFFLLPLPGPQVFVPGPWGRILVGRGRFRTTWTNLKLPSQMAPELSALQKQRHRFFWVTFWSLLPWAISLSLHGSSTGRERKPWDTSHRPALLYDRWHLWQVSKGKVLYHQTFGWSLNRFHQPSSRLCH